MKKQNSHHERSRRNQSEHPKMRHRETRTEFFPGHVGRAMNAHELVTNDNPSIQEGKEATGHSTGHQ
jgi:hypothetical protein